MRNGLMATAAAIIFAAFAQPAQAQIRPWEISIAGGPSLPRGDLADEADTGYHVEGSIGFDVPLFPLGIRADAFWQELPDNEDEWFRQVGGIVNATLGFPMMLIEPYVLAGVGYLRTETPEDLHVGHTHLGETQSGVGFNAGAGIQFPFAGLDGFVEARYLNLLGNDDAKQFQSIPITLGIRF